MSNRVLSALFFAPLAVATVWAGVIGHGELACLFGALAVWHFLIALEGK